MLILSDLEARNSLFFSKYFVAYLSKKKKTMIVDVEGWTRRGNGECSGVGELAMLGCSEQSTKESSPLLIPLC